MGDNNTEDDDRERELETTIGDVSVTTYLVGVEPTDVEEMHRRQLEHAIELAEREREPNEGD